MNDAIPWKEGRGGGGGGIINVIIKNTGDMEIQTPVYCNELSVGQ